LLRPLLSCPKRPASADPGHSRRPIPYETRLFRPRVYLQARPDPRSGLHGLLHERRRALHARIIWRPLRTCWGPGGRGFGRRLPAGSRARAGRRLATMPCGGKYGIKALAYCGRREKPWLIGQREAAGPSSRRSCPPASPEGATHASRPSMPARPTHTSAVAILAYPGALREAESLVALDDQRRLGQVSLSLVVISV